MARISIVIAVFNGAATVGPAVESVLGQIDSSNREVILVDDGSTDDTQRVLEGYQNQIRVVSQSNRGPAAARNAGVAASSGELLAFLDADDTWMPGKLSKMIPLFESNPRAVLAYSDAVEVDENDQQVAPSITGTDRAHAPSLNELLAEWWPILPSTAIMKRKVFEECGGFPESLRAYEDPYLFLRARELGEFVFIPEPLTRYRRLPVASRMEKYAPYQELFIQLLRERYGRAANARVKETRKAYTVALGHEGMTALRRGDQSAARHSFARALRHDPMSIRTALRLLRTFLPQSVALALSGRSHPPKVR